MDMFHDTLSNRLRSEAAFSRVRARTRTSELSASKSLAWSELSTASCPALSLSRAFLLLYVGGECNWVSELQVGPTPCSVDA